MRLAVGHFRPPKLGSKASESRPVPMLAHGRPHELPAGDLPTGCGMADRNAIHGAGKRPHTMTVSAGGGATRAAAAASRAPKESVSLNVKRAFPFAFTVGVDLGERLLAQRLPVFC